ncbi:MAG: hypothetical protein ABIT68_07420 [Sphingomicrobium sp.]
MKRLNPTAIALIGGVLVLLLLLFIFARGGNENADRLSDDQIAGRAAATDPEKACASQATYDLIKRELFRRAAQVRGTDQAAFDQLAAASVVRMDAAMLKSSDEQRGLVICTGSLALDLPPGVAVDGGSRTLTADVEYSLQTAEGGGADALSLTNADAIITPLATLAKVGAAAADPLAPTAPEADAPGATPVVITEPPPLMPPPPASPPQARPSFNCQFARTRGEIAVCNDVGLAALDRQMAARFNGAMAQADGDQRAQLQSTRSRFITYRERCSSDDCIAEAYRGRMREISDIMAGNFPPPH